MPNSGQASVAGQSKSSRFRCCVANTACAMSSHELRAACSAGHLGIAQRLHSGGASVDAVDNKGRASLYHACRHGHLDVAQWLHSVGATVNATDNEGHTSLHIACFHGHLKLVHQAEVSIIRFESCVTKQWQAPTRRYCSAITYLCRGI